MYIALAILVVVVLAAAFFFARGRRPEPELEAPSSTPPPALTPPARSHPERAAPRAESPQSVPAEALDDDEDAEPARVESSALESAVPSVDAEEATEPVELAPPSAPKDDPALRDGLKASRTGWVKKLLGLFRGKKTLDAALLSDLEETLLLGDVGTGTTERLIASLKERLAGTDTDDRARVVATLRDLVHEMVDVRAPTFGAVKEKPFVVLVVGVNGAGKTTTVGKLASRMQADGKRVVLGAADTFRAAAVAQLETWGKRIGAPVVKGKDLTKPSAVVFDAVKEAVDTGADVVLVDTAGRLHTKTPLMDELRKMRDAASKALPGAPHEVLLVLDATTGQNGLTQAREFRETLGLTGVIVTKLDGTAKGGITLAICDELKLPVRFVGVGERVDDLRSFDAAAFATALFADDGDQDSAA